MIKIPLENPCMWIANMVYSKICHKYIHIMGEKTKQAKK